VTEKPIDLDQHRGMSAQRATESRRLISEVEAHEAKLHRLRAAAEEQFLALPAATWEEAGVKAKYLMGLYAGTLAGGDARTKRLIAAVLEDFERLSSLSAKGQ
jgi:hypothetical protein